MIALLQRVTRASVEIDGECVARIGRGLLVLACAEPEDDLAVTGRLLDRLLRYRVFADGRGRMNRSLLDLRDERAGQAQDLLAHAGQAQDLRAHAGLMLVPQFTLAADTRSGLRPSFTPAAPPELGRRMFEALVEMARARIPDVQCGRFGADMQVGLVNDGPVTFWLRLP
ncbi:MAG: D-aminoacyl-tRNA deacylase [Burkholderiaceae bacterium]